MKTIIKFLKFIKSYWKYIYQSVILGIILTLVSIPVPWLTKILIDTVLPTKNYKLLYFVLLSIFAFSFTIAFLSIKISLFIKKENTVTYS